MTTVENVSIRSYGEFRIPNDVIEGWSYEPKGQTFSLADLGQVALFVPSGLEWEIIEDYFPKTGLMNRAIDISRNPEYTPYFSNIPNHVDFFLPRKLSKWNGLSTSSAISRNWNFFESGGKVNVSGFDNGLIVYPTDLTDISDSITVDLLDNNSWVLHPDKSVNDCLGLAFQEWALEEGGKVASFLLGETNMISYRSPDNTVLGNQVSKFVASSVAIAAHEILKTYHPTQVRGFIRNGE